MFTDHVSKMCSPTCLGGDAQTFKITYAVTLPCLLCDMHPLQWLPGVCGKGVGRITKTGT